MMDVLYLSCYLNQVILKTWGSFGEFLFKEIDLPVLQQAMDSSTPPAPPMEKSTTTVMPTDNSAGKTSVSFVVCSFNVGFVVLKIIRITFPMQEQGFWKLYYPVF